MASYSIRDLEKITGIKAHTIRIWEQRYNLLEPKRTETNIRFYDDEDLRFLLNIAVLNNNGLKISKIARLTGDMVVDEVRKLCESSERFPDQVKELTLAMIDLEEPRFERVIARNTLRFGFEKTMLEIIYPFFSKVGLLWQTGSISPAHEHFISNLLRQKILVAIDGQELTLKPDAKKFLLFLPEGEFHEIGLLFAHYLIRSRGHKVIYLGQSLPFEDLVLIYNQYKPNVLLTVITTTPSVAEAPDYLSKLVTSFPDAPVYASGNAALQADLKKHDQLHLLSKIHDLFPLIESHSHIRSS